jgi:VWFA-related protein
MKLNFFQAFIVGSLFATLVVPAGALQVLAQEKQPPKKPEVADSQAAISVDVPLVNVDVVVTDNRGNFVTGLKKQHFRILEDGVPQTVSNFAPTDAPITIVVLIEFSKLAYQYFAYQATTFSDEFMNQLKKDDWVALMSFDLKPRIEVDFTKNKWEVQQHLRRMYFPSFSEAALFTALVDTLDRLKDVKGKKAVLLVASGFDTGLGKSTLDDALKACRQTDATIFAVGVGRDFIEYYRLDNIVYAQAMNQMGAFARATGGKAWFPRFQGEVPGIFREVAEYLRSQYSLGYTPSSPKRDGKMRKIKVELVNDNGEPLVILDQNNKKVKYQVYAREGYIVPKGVGD